MNTLQYVVGEAKAGQPAVIRFFGRVTEETTSRFNDEFDFLENIIRPSCIRVLINSEGGSVLYGMSTYSTIANATVDTECIIEGVAASMASIIWAAGKRSLMRDYAILMIHNPMLPDDDGGEPFRIQIILPKKFPLPICSKSSLVLLPVSFKKSRQALPFFSCYSTVCPKLNWQKCAFLSL